MVQQGSCEEEVNAISRGEWDWLGANEVQGSHREQEDKEKITHQAMFLSELMEQGISVGKSHWKSHSRSCVVPSHS